MGRLKPRNRQKAFLTNRMRLIIGGSVFLVAFVSIFIFIKLSDVEESRAFVEGDYRTTDSGYWEDEEIWEQFDGSDWVPVEGSPESKSAVIIIDSGHVVMMDEEIHVSKFIIEHGASVKLLSNSIRIDKSKGEGYLSCEGKLDMGDCIIEGNADFITAADAMISFGSPYGFVKDGTTGNVQLKGKYSLSELTIFQYNGSVPQETGSGLPSSIRKLVIDNPEGVTLSYDVLISNKLELKSGVLFTTAKSVTLGTKPDEPGELKVDRGSVCGELRLMSSLSIKTQMNFPMSDGKSKTMINVNVDDNKLKDGYVMVKYYPGSVLSDDRSPFAASEYVVVLTNNGFFTSKANQGLKDASYIAKGMKVDASENVVSIWSLVDYRTLSKSEKENNGNGSQEAIVSNIICGPNPFKSSLMIRFFAERSSMVMIDIVDPKGKSVHHSKIDAEKGFNNWQYSAGNSLVPGNYFVRLSTASEIHTLVASKAGVPG